MLTEQDVRKALHDTIHSDAPQSWSNDYNFREGGSLDSLDHVTFLLALDERHGFKFKDEDVPQLNTIRAVLDFAARAGG
jgi:acyl carrier protein